MSDLPACYLIHKSGEWKLMAKKREKNLSAENRSPRLFPAVRTHTHPLVKGSRCHGNMACTEPVKILFL